jgi:uncharacterized RDD family membrane protein YckC
MLAAEARAAVRAAEAASMAAIQAQAAAESVLAGLEAASSVSHVTQAAQSWDPEFFTPATPQPAVPAPVEPVRSVPHPAAPVAARPSRQSSAKQSFEIRYDEDLPVRESPPAVSRASHGTTSFEPSPETSWQPEPALRSPLETEGFELVEPALPIHANLIQFPRELVATRRIRPRRAEGPYAESDASLTQLSIFEVDPGAATCVARDWSGMELDEEPPEEIVSPAPAAAKVEIAEPVSAALPLQTAPLNRRFLAAIVDFSLITGSFLAAAMVASANGMTLHSLKVAELGAVVAIPLIGVLYLALFLTLAKATPGMKYANLEICTFTGEKPTRTQRLHRMAALVLSLAPVGMGAAWALFDQQHLCWHDRLSGTYIRRT